MLACKVNKTRQTLGNHHLTQISLQKTLNSMKLGISENAQEYSSKKTYLHTKV